MYKEEFIAICAIGVIAIILVITYCNSMCNSMNKIYEKNAQTIEKESEQVKKAIKHRTNLVKKAKSEKATCYVDGKKQDEDFDPEGLSVDNYEVEYTDHCLYFKKIEKSPKSTGGGGGFFPIFFPLFH